MLDTAACLALAPAGANSWQVFWNVTLPNIRWGLLYGVILTNAVRKTAPRRLLLSTPPPARVLLPSRLN